jgi:hypothetical protein
MPLVDILSEDRFATYRLWAGDDDTLAERLYSYNIALSSELYSSLHMLEVALRNKADGALTAAYGSAWYDDAATVMRDIYQQQRVVGARTTLLREKKIASPGQIIAELNFGFWSSLFGKQSHHLWGTLRPIFHVRGIHRSDIAGKLRDLRQLRNRVAHYEPVLGRPLTELHANLLELSGWLSPDAAAWIETHSNWNDIHPAAPLLVRDRESSNNHEDVGN